MKKLLTYVSFLLLAVSCNTNKTVVARVPKAPATNMEEVVIKPEETKNAAVNVVKEISADAKPVVLKRTMRRPAVI